METQKILEDLKTWLERQERESIKIKEIRSNGGATRQRFFLVTAGDWNDETLDIPVLTTLAKFEARLASSKAEEKTEIMNFIKEGRETAYWLAGKYDPRDAGWKQLMSDVTLFDKILEGLDDKHGK